MSVTTIRTMMGMCPLLLCCAAGSAEVPGVLTHVPEGTAVYAVIPDVGALLGDISALNTALAGKLPPDAAQLGMGLFFAQSIVSQPGFDTNGSAALIIDLPEGGMGAGEPTVTTLLPISDLEAFSKAPFMAGQGASFADGMASVTMDAETLHMRDLGDYTIAGNDRGAIEAFAGGEFMGAHKTALGASGVKAVEATDFMFVLSVPALDGQIAEGLAQLEQQANFLAMMGGGEQVTQLFGAVKQAADAVRSDGSVLMFSADAGGDGVSLDMGVSFREGTESAAAFAAEGDSGALLDKLPNEDFLVAYSMDASSEGVGSLIGAMAALGGEGMNLGAVVEGMSGASGMIGTSPAALGGAGLLSKQITYTRAADADTAVKSMAASLKEMDGQAMMGMKYATTYEAGAAEVAGVPVDTYSVKTSMDMGGGGDANPMAMMMDPAMINSMLFGMSGGPSGYVAKVDDGYYQTSSKNSELLTAALNAGKGGEGLRASETLGAVASKLHADRFAEVFISLDQAFNTFGPFAQMMGMVDQFEPMPAMAPVGLSMAGSDGGLSGRIRLNAETIGFLAEFAAEMEADQMMPMGGGDDMDGEPDF
jgi:hypothetical protein